VDGFIEVAIGVAIIILASSVAKYWMPMWSGYHGRRQLHNPQPVQYAQNARTASNVQTPQQAQITAKSLETYERLAKDKLEVIKTALAMGYNDADLEKLDARLEKLVGTEALAAILRGSGAQAMASADLMDTQLDHEVDRLRDLRQQQR
jgi:hypothetical protein